ncbi:Siderochrome-iron transporter [Pleurostoma richardsiae]|uniref:Siderochrome-iron transporter n=1 Tax=Pleurostoma richardsiae TaxID=41990 RepID=A0AA38RF02_9PEZI|nr:Siderochrome-iron transporter [Pleurostoma richardsiae]
MGFIGAVQRQFRPSAAEDGEVPPQDDAMHRTETSGAGDDQPDEKRVVQEQTIEAGVSTIEAAQAIWGKTGRWIVIAGLAMIMIIYEIDNSTVYIYNNYSTSSFNALSMLASLSTASTIIFAVVKPPIAKLSDVIGRGQTYVMTISFYILAYILMASAKTINTYAAGIVFYSIGQSGTNLMNDVLISDISTARWRGFAIGLSFFPFLITPWVAAYIVDSVVAPNGIGWRWGIGMLAILMPFCASFIITTLLYYQGLAKKMGLAPRVRITIYDFCSQIDLGGVLLFSGGLALLLLPMTLAATSTNQWRTPYVDALIAVGGALLIALPFYEAKVAAHPVVPVHYFKNMTIVMCLVLIATDSLGFSCTHTYIYTWGTIAHGFSARNDTFFVYTNGVVQCLVGILAGLVMAYTRRYKFLAITGAVIRTIGYGVMLRLRGADNSTAELFVVQAIQGIGSGIMQTTLLVPAQISVPHAQMAQITALVVCVSTVGSSVGACIAGGIYTNTLKPALWKHLGDSATAELVDSLFNSITGVVPDWGTPQREAINKAFSDVMRYMTYAALGSSIPALGLAWLLPNHKLPTRNNLVEN